MSLAFGLDSFRVYRVEDGGAILRSFFSSWLVVCECVIKIFLQRILDYVTISFKIFLQRILDYVIISFKISSL